MTKGLLGIAYKPGGRDAERDGGLDCWGFFRHARKVLGMSVPPVELLEDGERNEDRIDNRRNGGEWERIGRAEPGCLVLFEKEGARRRYHVGIVMSDGLTFAHCPFGGESRTDRLDCQLYAKWRRTFYRYGGKHGQQD